MSLFFRRREVESDSESKEKVQKRSQNRFHFENGQHVSFNSKGLLPVILQDTETRDVLHLGYVDRNALYATLETGQIHLYSRSKREIQLFGDGKGEIFHLVEAKIDRTRLCLLLQVYVKAENHQLKANRSSFEKVVFTVWDQQAEE